MKKLNDQIKILSSAMLLLGALTVSGYSAPAQTVSVNSEATFGGVREANFTLVIRDATTPPFAEKSRVEWDVFDPEFNRAWKLSNSMIELSWSVTDAFGGIQIYTDNTTKLANPHFLDPTPGRGPDDPRSHNRDSNPAGLLYVPYKVLDSIWTLPMGWCVKPSTVQLNQDLFAADPDTGPATGLGNRYQWFYILDKKTPAIDRNGDGSWTGPEDGLPFVNGDPYIRVVDHRGIHTTQGPADFSFVETKRAWIYFMANFQTAAAQATYKTSRLLLEAYIE